MWEATSDQVLLNWDLVQSIRDLACSLEKSSWILGFTWLRMSSSQGCEFLCTHGLLGSCHIYITLTISSCYSQNNLSPNLLFIWVPLMPVQAWGILKGVTDLGVDSYFLAFLAWAVLMIVLGFFIHVLDNVIDAIYICFAIDRDRGEVCKQDVHEVYVQLLIGRNSRSSLGSRAIGVWPEYSETGTCSHFLFLGCCGPVICCLWKLWILKLTPVCCTSTSLMFVNKEEILWCQVFSYRYTASTSTAICRTLLCLGCHE